MILKCTFKNKASDSVLIGGVARVHIASVSLDSDSVWNYCSQGNTLIFIDEDLVDKFISETGNLYPAKELFVVFENGRDALHVVTDSVAFVLENGKTVDKINASFSIAFKEWFEGNKTD